MKLSLHSPEDAGKLLRYNFRLCNGLNLFPVSGQTRPPLLRFYCTQSYMSGLRLWRPSQDGHLHFPASVSVSSLYTGLTVAQRETSWMSIEFTTLRSLMYQIKSLGDLSCIAFSWMNEKVTLSCLDVPQALNPCFFGVWKKAEGGGGRSCHSR